MRVLCNSNHFFCLYIKYVVYLQPNVKPKSKSIMRKVLLLGAALLVSAGIMAQSTGERTLVGASNKYKQVQKTQKIENAAQQTSTPVSKPVQNLNTKAAQAITKTYIGTSANCFSVLLPESACLSANQETGIILMTHRQDASVSSGNIQSSYSTDGGFSFDDSTLTTWKTAWGYPGRYPSGVIYNPTGNTTPANAYAVAAGPILNSAPDFCGGFFSSITFGGANMDSTITLYTTDTAGGLGQINAFPRMHMQSRGNKVFLYGDANTDDGTYYTSIHTTVNIGTFNSTNQDFDWVRVSHTPGYLTDGSGNPDGYVYPGFAMDNDGSVGYLIYIGRDGAAADQLTYQPLIYKTTDGGLNWTKQAAFNWASIPAIQTLATDLSPVGRPMFSTVKDATIDGDGYLHFTNYIHGAFSDNADSLGYYAVYTGMQGIVFDTYQTSTGWASMAVDTIYASDPDKATTLIDPGTADYVAWDDRFQMSRTADGSKIVYAWMDTDPSLSEVNIYPDIMVKMYDVATGTMGPKVNVTAGTDYDANNYWLYLADITFDKGTYYQVNLSTSTLNSNSSGTVDHEYVTGVYLDETGNLIAGVNDLPLDAAIAMYPNPTSGDLNISFNDLAAGNYSVVVYNTIGGVVLSQNIDVNGAVVRSINMNELPTGIYMVQVSNENGSTTKKVIKN